jgi:hypothetical protein
VTTRLRRVARGIRPVSLGSRQARRFAPPPRRASLMEKTPWLLDYPTTVYHSGTPALTTTATPVRFGDAGVVKAGPWRGGAGRRCAADARDSRSPKSESEGEDAAHTTSRAAQGRSFRAKPPRAPEQPPAALPRGARAYISNMGIRPVATYPPIITVTRCAMKVSMGVSEGAAVLTPEAQHDASEITSMTC